MMTYQLKNIITQTCLLINFIAHLKDGNPFRILSSIKVSSYELLCLLNNLSPNSEIEGID